MARKISSRNRSRASINNLKGQMTTMQETKQIKLKPEIFEALNNLKDEDESWNYFFKRMILIPSNSRELKPVVKKEKTEDPARSELNTTFNELWAWIIEQPKTQGWKAYKLGVKDVQFLKAQLKKHGLEKMKHFYKCACNDKFLQENNVPLSMPNMFSDKAIAKWLIIKDSTVSRRDEILKKKNEETLAYLNSLHGTTTKAVATPHYENLKDLPAPLTEEEENAKYYHQAEDLRARVQAEQKKEMDAAYPYKPLIADKPVNPVGFQSLGELL
jgi:hypothetical protein